MAFLLAGLSLLAAAQAAVTPVEVKGGCSKLPQYSSSTGIAGPWIITADHCVGATANTKCNIEGFGSESVDFRNGEKGYIGIVPENTQAKTPLRCNDATGSFEARVVHDGADWLAVNVTDMPYSAQLMWGLGQYSVPVQAYEHYEDGVRQDGFFLGAHNVTTWALQEVPASSAGGSKPYWQIRLLGPGSQDPQTGKPLYEGETLKSFIRIDGISV